MNAPPDDVEATPPESEEAPKPGLKARLREHTKPLIGMAIFGSIAVLAVIVWYAWQADVPVAEQTAPLVQTSDKEQFTEQVDLVLKGKATRLYFSDLVITDELLDELPLDTLLQESIDAAEENRKTSEILAQQSELDDDGESRFETARQKDTSADDQVRSRGNSGDKAQTKPTFARLDTVLIDQGVVTDKGLDVISQLPDLEHLRLRLSPITDNGIASLAACNKLWLLNLPHCRVSTEGIRKLKKLPKLKQLRLGSPNLSNECCRAIAELTTLRGLHLIGVPVTDEGLKVLTTLPRLESLYLDDPAITDIGWMWLFRNHPQLHVHVNQKHHDHDPHAHVH
ncbi:hypothetical protein FHS27_000447 [Rhodopirellula rubra]|uniref:Leucine Rich repeats (2 copies) n=1 Tax=Aporhodopirellula rubra TaxID=980271 RepID=A0A7W5H410_9BACT|nr:transcriptional regulator [Aporhodopirellula rubra]MBB3204683.1 hypothetical protein [Aporhodopirellula rubra]